MFITQSDKSKEISGLITRAVTVIHGKKKILKYR